MDRSGFGLAGPNLEEHVCLPDPHRGYAHGRSTGFNRTDLHGLSPQLGVVLKCGRSPHYHKCRRAFMDLFSHESRTLQTLLHQGYAPSVVYDIGASNGVWSDAIALALPEAEYYLFEPLAESVPFYRSDLKERLARRPKFHVHAVALSDHSGNSRNVRDTRRLGKFDFGSRACSGGKRACSCPTEHAG